MRNPSYILSAASLFLALAHADAQQRKPITIDQVRVGYQRLGPEYEFKAGFWTPVYVDVAAGPQGSPVADLVVEVDDSDDVRTRFTTTLPPLQPNEQITLLSYTKPGSTASEVQVTALIDGRVISVHQEMYPAMALGHQLYLSIGARLPALRRALSPEKKSAGEEDGPPSDTGPRRLTVLDDTRVVPNRWFAYEPIDLMILSTGNREFLTSLLNEREGRKEAIVDWLRRGGKLIVCVGRNQDIVSQMEPIQTLLPVSLKGITPIPQLHSLRVFSNESRSLEALQDRSGQAKRVPIEIAKLEPKPGREIDVLAAEHNGPNVIVRGSYGLGSVTVVAFDPDQPPFANLPSDFQAKFWGELVNRTIPAPKAEQINLPGRPVGIVMDQDASDLATQLHMNLEQFEEVPVISFGWVALFILVYILIVGPLDYFFLKKVLKRLELTWITFPTVVITISVIAYFTAYWLKGNDQRINKLDVVDIDLQTQQVYGNTWFTVFSPRIQHYTLGLQPLGAVPGPASPETKPGSSLVISWTGRPEMGFRGSNRAGSQGLFRRAYDYMPDATGLVGVPIQVWSTKSFECRWEMPIDAAKPLFSANLRHPKGRPEAISGEILSRLPIELKDVVLHYRRGSGGKWYQLDDLLPGVPKRVDNLAREGGLETNQWVGINQDMTRRPGTQQRTSLPHTLLSTSIVVKRMLFQLAADPNARNNALAYLDQSWRLGRKNEVILVGRIVRQDGLAEEVSQRPGGLSQLWIGSLPESGQARPPLLGTLSQEAYVRIIIPVKDADSE